MFTDNDKRYQVFVSSTFVDLKAERDKVLQAILELRAFPSGMELFPSADDEQWEFIKREIISSDYYVVILAGKYGSLSPDGVGFTEKEYDYARETGKPVMGFLFHDLEELKGGQLEQDESKRAKLRTFRDKVAAERLVRFYRNPDDLKAQVWQSLTNAFQRKPQKGWVPAEYARRIENLEQITSLQTKLNNLEVENAALRAAAQDQRQWLRQGDDSETWILRVGWVNRPNSYPSEFKGQAYDEWLHSEKESEIVEFEFKATWSELFQSCFQDRMNSVSVDDVNDRLKILITRRALENGVSERWYAKHRREYDNSVWPRVARAALGEFGQNARVSEAEVSVRYVPAPLFSDLAKLRAELDLQFQALNLIEVGIDQGRPASWTLTVPNGVLQLALLLGKLRQN